MTTLVRQALALFRRVSNSTKGALLASVTSLVHLLGALYLRSTYAAIVHEL